MGYIEIGVKIKRNIEKRNSTVKSNGAAKDTDGADLIHFSGGGKKI